MKDIKITVANDYFEMMGKTIDWDDTQNLHSEVKDTVTLVEYLSVEKIIALEISIHLSRNSYIDGRGVDGSIVDCLTLLREAQIIEYEKDFKTKYIKHNIL